MHEETSARLEEFLNMSVEQLWRARVSSVWMTAQIDRELARRKWKAEDLSAYDGLIR